MKVEFTNNHNGHRRHNGHVLAVAQPAMASNGCNGDSPLAADLAALRALGLTGRQAEIAFWLAHGKTNEELSIIVGVSPRTVAHHVESILARLHLCARAQVMLRVLEALGWLKWPDAQPVAEISQAPSGTAHRGKTAHRQALANTSQSLTSGRKPNGEHKMKTHLTQPNGSTKGTPKFRALPSIRRFGAALILALTIAATFGLARTSDAVPFRFTLSGVTFNDGSTASGYFYYDPVADTFGPFSITTTAGMFTGGSYSPGAGTTPFFLGPSPDIWIFDNFGIDDHYLVLSYMGHISSFGSYMLEVGTAMGIGAFDGSGEYVNAMLDYRLLTAGSLNVTPEGGSALAFLSMGLVAVEGFRRHGRRRLKA